MVCICSLMFYVSLAHNWYLADLSIFSQLVLCFVLFMTDELWLCYEELLTIIEGLNLSYHDHWELRFEIGIGSLMFNRLIVFIVYVTVPVVYSLVWCHIFIFMKGQARLLLGNWQALRYLSPSRFMPSGLFQTSYDTSYGYDVTS
jgi:hypothetical protein